MTSEYKLNDLDDAIIVALGSNLAGAHPSLQDLLAAAIVALGEAGLKVVRQSRWWRSAAWPHPHDPAYLNGVIFVETALSPTEVLTVLHRVEASFGRDRGMINAPRTLDLDLIAHGRTVAEHPALPHPRAHERLFVMGPLAEIAPDWRHPVLNATADELFMAAKIGLDSSAI